MFLMSDIITIVRKVAARAVGADSPALDAIVAAVMADLTSAIRDKRVPTSEIRPYAKNLAKVKATRAFAVERHAAIGVGRESSVMDVRITREVHCRISLDSLINELQRAASVARETTLTDSTLVAA